MDNKPSLVIDLDKASQKTDQRILTPKKLDRKRKADLIERRESKSFQEKEMEKSIKKIKLTSNKKKVFRWSLVNEL